MFLFFTLCDPKTNFLAKYINILLSVVASWPYGSILDYLIRYNMYWFKNGQELDNLTMILLPNMQIGQNNRFFTAICSGKEFN